jgi:geranylgeranyl transferase type-1 subunit beta
MLLRGIPAQASSLDLNRVTVLLFSLNSLDLLNEPLSDEQRGRAIEWIYARQCPTGGFDGSPFHVRPRAHIVSTHAALVSLALLNDDLSRVRRDATLGFIARLQNEDGCFRATEEGSEADLRFLYCACACSVMLSARTSGNAHPRLPFHEARALEFLARCQSPCDGGFGLGPGQEAHGGGCFCAIASFRLLGVPVPDAERALEFCVRRQDAGFHGRVHKADDTCYGFWVGASILMLGSPECINRARLNDFLDSTAHRVGGYGKVPDAFPDPLHSHFGVFARAIAQGSANLSMDAVALGMTRRAFEAMTEGAGREAS